MKKIYLHIGTHKTGSTSVQRWLTENESLLNDRGYDLYHGQHNSGNHVELYLAAMRYDRDSFGKQAMKNTVFDEKYTDEVCAKVNRFISESKNQKLLLSTEGLSLLRHQDELKRLRKILGSDYESIRVIVVLRDRKDFLDSYRLQLNKKKGRIPSKDYWSALYVEDDTWLTDYEGLLSAYADEFGRENIRVIDYDEQMKSEGNIIPAFLQAIDFKNDAEVNINADSYAYNKTLPTNNR